MYLNISQAENMYIFMEKILSINKINPEILEM